MLCYLFLFRQEKGEFLDETSFNSSQMNSTDEMYKYAYVPIQGVPEYIDFTFSVNWIAIYTLITITYSIPCTVVLIRLVYFHFNHKKSYGIFNAFVHMQLLTTFLGFSDFLAVRIPSCGVFTSYCASRDPQWYMKISTFLYYGSSFSGQLLTVMFCGMRVVYLYFPAYVQKVFEHQGLEPRKPIHKSFFQKFENSFNICSLITILISFLVAFPNFLSSGVCLQLVPPFPYGALVILSMFHYGNLVIEISEFILISNQLSLRSSSIYPIFYSVPLS